MNIWGIEICTHCLEPEPVCHCNDGSFDWYKSLDVNQRINLKQEYKALCGISWSEAAVFFSMKERIKIMYDKLKQEEII